MYSGLLVLSVMSETRHLNMPSCHTWFTVRSSCTHTALARGSALAFISRQRIVSLWLGNNDLWHLVFLNNGYLFREAITMSCRSGGGEITWHTYPEPNTPPDSKGICQDFFWVTFSNRFHMFDKTWLIAICIKHVSYSTYIKGLLGPLIWSVIQDLSVINEKFVNACTPNKWVISFSTCQLQTSLLTNLKIKCDLFYLLVLDDLLFVCPPCVYCVYCTWWLPAVKPAVSGSAGLPTCVSIHQEVIHPQSFFVYLAKEELEEVLP